MSTPPPLRKPLFPPTDRVLGACLAVGVLGVLAALAFDATVELSQKLLLAGLGGFRPPRVGVLDPTVALPPWRERWRIPLVTGLGGLLSGLLVFMVSRQG